MEKNPNDMSSREFLRRFGLEAGSAVALMDMDPLNVLLARIVETLKK